MLEQPNISYEELKAIKIPTIILAGQRDIVRLDHTKSIANNIKNSVLEIINGEGHGSYIVHSSKIYDIIKKYI